MVNCEVLHDVKEQVLPFAGIQRARRVEFARRLNKRWLVN